MKFLAFLARCVEGATISFAESEDEDTDDDVGNQLHPVGRRATLKFVKRRNPEVGSYATSE
jgi:hypothetical protein